MAICSGACDYMNPREFCKEKMWCSPQCQIGIQPFPSSWKLHKPKSFAMKSAVVFNVLGAFVLGVCAHFHVLANKLTL